MSALKASQELCEQGVIVVPQVTPRPFMIEFTFAQPSLAVASLESFRPAMGLDREGRKKLLADTNFRAAFGKDARATDRKFTLQWDQTLVSQSRVEPNLEERTLGEIAAERGTNAVDLALDLAIASDLETRFRMPLLNDDEDQVAKLITGEHTVLGLSDAGAHANMLCDACQGTYLLGRWVREKQAIPMERAIWMLTARPAGLFGITDRGRLQPGLAADVVIFDRQKVGAGRLRRVNDFPAGQERLVSDALGIHMVIVNGVPIRRENKDLLSQDAKLPGRVLRGGGSARSSN